jgi:cytochrome c oxidase subunit III
MSEAAKEGLTLDVSDLPAYAFGQRSMMWCGTLGVIVIEGTMFAMMIGAYFYLRGRVPHWPPNHAPPELRWAVVNTVILLLSLLPNWWYKRAAEREELKKVRVGLVVAVAFAVAFTVVRFYEFGALNVNWDSNAYGSVVWTLLGLHTAHLITDLIDTLVLTTLMFTGPIEGKRFADVSDNAFYWYFVVLAWLPVFAVIYLVPRWL